MERELEEHGSKKTKLTDFWKPGKIEVKLIEQKKPTEIKLKEEKNENK